MERKSWKRIPLSTTTVLCALVLEWIVWSSYEVEAVCVPSTGCPNALAYYKILNAETLDIIATKFGTTSDAIVAVNSNILDKNYIVTGDSIYIPFKCDCLNQNLSHQFYYQITGNETTLSVATETFEGLTQLSWIGVSGAYLTIPINCSCGDPLVSTQYGLFLTYVVASGTGGNLNGLASHFNISADLLKQFNPLVEWGNSQAQQIAFIPVPASVKPGGGVNIGVIVGAATGGIVILLIVFALALYFLRVYISRKHHGNKLRLSDSLVANDGGSNSAHDHLQSPSSEKSRMRFGSTTPVSMMDFTVDKSVEFSYEELANATDNFSVAKKIGEGGFASVFYGVIRGQKLAIKRMNLQATKEFMAELQVLTHVHHTNLVQLIGYCTVEYLFLIYEFVENGTLDQHLHSSKGYTALSWTGRVQIALDAARGLEYIHEHTKPTYIHRDIKSANILIDKQLHAKVADFGLTKLTESRLEGSLSTSMPTRVVGTWGYMSPEYARYGDVSPMVDVYSYGVVLFEILSGREAIVRGAATGTSSSLSPPKEEQRALVSLPQLVQETVTLLEELETGFERSDCSRGSSIVLGTQLVFMVAVYMYGKFDHVLREPDGKERLGRLMDPALQYKYPLDAAWKVAQLAGACTQEDPDLRPTMRKAVVALMTLSSSTQEWEVSAIAADGGIIAGR